MEKLKLFYNFTYNKLGSKGYYVKLFNLNHECSNLNLLEFSNLEVYFLFFLEWWIQNFIFYFCNSTTQL
jgi:hypothetical protein